MFMAVFTAILMAALVIYELLRYREKQIREHMHAEYAAARKKSEDEALRVACFDRYLCAFAQEQVLVPAENEI